MNINFTKIDKLDIIKIIKKRLSKERCLHCIAVAYTASALAMVHDVNVEHAILAGLLHDYAKSIPYDEQLDYCYKHRIPLSEYEIQNPQVIHGKVGAFMIMKKFSIYNEDVINSIINHTLGRPNMSKLEKIIFISDYIEPEREPLKDIELIRKIAFKNLDEAVYIILNNIISYLNTKNVFVDESSLKTLQYYKKEAKIE